MHVFIVTVHTCPASSSLFPLQVSIKQRCGEAVIQPNAPERPKIYNHHLHLPDITGTVSVTVSDRNLQGELSPPLLQGEVWGEREEGESVCEAEMHLSISSG